MTSYQARSTWCFTRFGSNVQVHRRTMDEASVQLGIMEFQPVAQAKLGRAHLTYVTNGMSERRMPWLEGPTVADSMKRNRIELLVYTQNKQDWIIDLLAEVAQYPFLHRTGFLPGHTFSVSSPLQQLWDGYVLTLPLLEDEGLNPLGLAIDSISGDPVMWLQVVGIMADELAFGMAAGGNELLEPHLKLNQRPEFLLLAHRRPSALP
jgi:hypothetical protein